MFVVYVLCMPRSNRIVVSVSITVFSNSIGEKDLVLDGIIIKLLNKTQFLQ